MKPDALLMLLFGVLAAVSATVSVICFAYGNDLFGSGAVGLSVFSLIVLLFESGEAEITEPEIKFQYWRCVNCGERHHISRMVEYDGLRCPACVHSDLDAPFEARR